MDSWNILRCIVFVSYTWHFGSCTRDGYVALCCIIVLSLITICESSYLKIQAKLSCKLSFGAAAIANVHNRQNAPERNLQLSRTLFIINIVIALSHVCLCPSTLGHCTHYQCSECVSLPLLYFLTIFRLANSFVNPLIYFFRLSMFRETWKRMRLQK